MKQSRLRLAANRLGDGPIPGLLYEFGAIHFDPNVRLTVVAAFSDSRTRPDFEGTLRLLGDEGVGADRSSGYGRFEVEAAEPFTVSLGAGMRLSLSLLHPAEAEVTGGLLDEPARYDLVIRGGWVTGPGARTLRKRNVRMLSEGSVIRDLGRERYGDSPEVLEPRPELGLHHPVYRPGVAVAVPIERRVEKS
jgi:CRISPR-associated protein Csm4